jgi:hypothetical protein
MPKILTKGAAALAAAADTKGHKKGPAVQQAPQTADKVLAIGGDFVIL